MSLRLAKLLVVASSLALITAILFRGIDAIPFHPDETSWLVQSLDLELLASDPGALAYKGETDVSAEMSYRLLNAPVAKYALGIGRRLAGFTVREIPADWQWTESWEANRQRGAVPSPDLLRAARLTSTALLVLSLFPLFLVGRRLGGAGTGLLAILLLATNASVLLHGRRAMAEGALILVVNLAIAGVLWGDRLPWLAGLSLGLALATKQSTLPMLPVGLLGVLWSATTSDKPVRAAGLRLAMCGLVMAGVWAILNPVAWRNPASTFQAMAAERDRLVSRQVADFAISGEAQVIHSVTGRAAGLMAALFFAEPQVREAANYDAFLAQAQRAYLADPSTHILRGWIGGAAMLLLTLLGIALGSRRVAGPDVVARRDFSLLLLLTLAQLAGLLVALPLIFQRYYVPLVPLTSLWIALALTDSARILRPRASFSATKA